MSLQFRGTSIKSITPDGPDLKEMTENNRSRQPIGIVEMTMRQIRQPDGEPIGRESRSDY